MIDSELDRLMRCAQDDQSVDSVEPAARMVTVPPDTPLYCHHCHDTDAPEYRLRRKSGKYVALCHRPDGTGCWIRDAVPMCDYQDFQGVQCSLVAEWVIKYGPDQLVEAYRCVAHVGPGLGSVTEHRVFAV